MRVRRVVLGAALAGVIALTGIPALADGRAMAAKNYGDRRPEAADVEAEKQAASPDVSTNLVGPSPAVTVAKLTGQQSINATDSRYAVFGTDLGVTWDNGQGQMLMAFGDTFGSGWIGFGGGGDDWRCQTLARTSDTDLSDGVTFDDMVTDRPGHAKQLLPCEQSEADGEVTVIPTAGIAVGNRQYLHYFSIKTWGPWTTNYAGIAYSDDNGETWVKDAKTRWLNTPTYDEPFQMAAFMREGKWVYMYGTANGRFGSVHVARVPADKLLELSAYEYWDGRRWQGDDQKAAPIAVGPAGEMSVGYDKYLDRYVMSTLDEYRAAVVMREAPTPLGPWSGQRVLVQGGEGSPYAGLYAPFFNPASLSSGSPDLYFNMSLWGPYNVFLMKTTLDRQVDTANLLSDPGLEEQRSGMPSAPWVLEGRGGVDRDVTWAHGGKNNGFVRATAGWNTLKQTVNIRPGHRYEFSAWVRSADIKTAGRVGVRGSEGDVVTKSFPSTKGAWTNVKVTFKSRSLTTVDVFAGFWSDGMETWVQVDDTALREVG